MKQVSGFLSVQDKLKLRALAAYDDRKLAPYVTRLLIKHIRDNEQLIEKERLVDLLKQKKNRKD